MYLLWEKLAPNVQMNVHTDKHEFIRTENLKEHM